MDINKLTSKIKGEPKPPFIIKPVSKGMRSQGAWSILLLLEFDKTKRRLDNQAKRFQINRHEYYY